MGRRRKDVLGLAQPRPTPKAGSVTYFLLAVSAQIWCSISFWGANTGLATGGRQRLRNREATRERISLGTLLL